MKCPNGHYYKEELSACPYCSTGNKLVEIADPKKETQLYTESKEVNKTRLVIPQTPSAQLNNNRTVLALKYRIWAVQTK